MAKTSRVQATPVTAQHQPMPPSAGPMSISQIYAVWGDELLRRSPKQAEFRAEELDLTAAEAWLFFGDSVYVSASETPDSALRSAVDAGMLYFTTLWNGLLMDPESRGWALVELLEAGGPLREGMDVDLPMLLWTKRGWVWVQGGLDAGRVRRGLSIWGVLQHSRVVERPISSILTEP